MSGQSWKLEAEASRKTKETEVEVRLRLGSSETSVSTEIGFLDHLLEAAGFHGRWGLSVEARGDLHVDYHHLVEDVALVLGEAFGKLLEGRPSLTRFGNACVPMDEALCQVTVDTSGRGSAYMEREAAGGWIRDFDACLAYEFIQAMARTSGVTLHVQMLRGESPHHKLEALFKALGLSMKQAFSPSPDKEPPSTKGTLGGGL